MQRLVAFIVIAVALSPNATNGAELGVGELKPNYAPPAQNFDGSYDDEAAQNPERKLSRNVEKIMTYMASAGLDGAGVKRVTYYVNDHMDDENFRIASGTYKGFKLQFSHDIAMPSANHLKLRLSDQEMPHWEISGSTRGVMLNYKLEFK